MLTITNFGATHAPYAGLVTELHQNTLVVGGGIIGLASAFQIARSGRSVTLFDPTPARGATWAAAGMLAPSAEIGPGEEQNYQLQRGAVVAWRRLSDELAAVTGRHVTIHETGTLVVGWDASDRRLLKQFIDQATLLRAPLQVVSRSESPELFVGLSDRIGEGVVMSDDAWLDPDEAVVELMDALRVVGVDFVEEQVELIGADESGVFAQTSNSRFSGRLGILATGSVSLPRGAAPTGRHSIRPVRGMTVRVQGVDRSAQPTVRAFIRGRAFYMVSRPGGYCVLGATSDERREPVIEVGELQRALRDALDIVPSLETAALVDTRVGLRPASEDLRPFFEEWVDLGWAWSSGHYRHGITLAPLAALEALHYAERRS